MHRLDVEKNQEEFLNLIEEIKNHLVLVEGKKDVRALKSLGIENIVAINGKPLIEIVEKLYKYLKHPYSKEISMVILTDFDHEGKNLASKFKILFQKYHIKYNSRLRNNFMKFGKSKIEDFKKNGFD